MKSTFKTIKSPAELVGFTIGLGADLLAEAATMKLKAEAAKLQYLLKAMEIIAAPLRPIFDAAFDGDEEAMKEAVKGLEAYDAMNAHEEALASLTPEMRRIFEGTNPQAEATAEIFREATERVLRRHFHPDDVEELIEKVVPKGGKIAEFPAAS